MSSAEAPKGGRPLVCGEPKSAAAGPTRAADVSRGRRAPPAGAAGHKPGKWAMGRDGCEITVVMMMLVLIMIMLMLVMVIITRIIIISMIMMMLISSASS